MASVLLPIAFDSTGMKLDFTAMPTLSIHTAQNQTAMVQ